MLGLWRHSVPANQPLEEACREVYKAPEPVPFKYVPLCPACAEHSQLVFYSLCAGCDERKRISKKATGV